MDDWHTVLDAHPIFHLPDSHPRQENDLDSDSEHGYVLSGRRQLMTLKDADLIVAAGSELRITSLWDAKLGRETGKSYKILHAPNVDFPIHQLALNPSSKLLAVAGAYQVAVVVLPRVGCSKVVSQIIDCKAVQVGQFYHGTTSSVPIAKVDWHPWGEGGSTLMVMTVDGKLREYDISVDSEEPQQLLSFIPEKKSRSFLAQDPAEREVTSFTLGKGRADWGPLTMYALTRSGDVYAICPYMPRNASIPSSFVHALECFIAAKQEFVSQDTTAASTLSTLYDYQHKYVSALVKQLPPGTIFPAVSRSVSMHPPSTMKNQLLRQGPFLLQPSPRTLEGSEGGDATDIIYMAFADGDDEDHEGSTERLGVIVVTYQDGKVDICLDVEKVEARWESRQDKGNELPMFAVYETIDLGVISMLKMPPASTSASLDLLQANHPVIHPDPIHDDTIHVYHAFGIHSLELGDLLCNLATALHADDDDGATLMNTLEKSVGTHASPILNTFSCQRRCPNPVVGLCVPNDVYLSYSILILTSVFRIVSFPLNLRTGISRKNGIPSSGPSLPSITTPPTSTPATFVPSDLLTPMDGPPAYVSLLGREPFVPPAIFTSLPRLSSGTPQREFMLTPDTLRFLASQVASITAHIRAVQMEYKSVEDRVEMQKAEFSRMQEKCGEMFHIVELLKERVREIQGVAEEGVVGRLEKIKGTHKELMKRADRILQAYMKGASPELSECETKWFEELGRMKAEVIGAGKFDEGSLKARTMLLKREYERIMPSLEDLVVKEEEQRRRVSDNSRSLGVSQAFELGERSNIEKTKIAELEKEIVKMASHMQLSLDPTPSTLNFFKPPSQPKDADKPKDAVMPTTTAIAVPPPSVLRGKTIEDIVNKWMADLDSHVREFNKFAGEVAVWDRALMENGNNLAAIYSHVLAVEREQSDIEQALDHVEQQQKDLSAALDAYERSVDQVLGSQGGSLRALDTGPADTERDKNYVLATELHSHLDDLSGSLTQMIDSVNALSLTPSANGSSHGSEDPMVQISQILSSHLESLQWIDGTVREVEGKVDEVEKRVRDVGMNGHTLGSSTSLKQRGFGLSR